jgi:hydroxyacylglutathione hydrolase
MIIVNTFLNEINQSNCYVVYNHMYKSCLVIDPGSRNSKVVIDFIEENKLSIDYIILTHSHFDHIAGVDSLLNYKKAILISSTLCSEKIVDPVRNLSYFSDFGIIQSTKADLLIEEIPEGRLSWNDITMNFISTPGHSGCSITVRIGDNLFTGDMMIKGKKTRVTYPDGNMEQVKNSLDLIKNTILSSTNIYPGHGESYMLDPLINRT